MKLISKSAPFKLLAVLLSLFGTVFAVLHISLADARRESLIEITDFCHQFYFAGHMVANGLGHDLYPPLSATAVVGSPPDLYAHKLLTSFESRYALPFVYFPVVAVIAMPFAGLPFRQGLVAWQLTAIAFLFASCILASFSQARYKKWACSLFLFLSASLLFPLVQTVVIGQTSILFGLFPLSLGAFFLLKKRYLASGFSFALLFLKPQLLVSLALILVIKVLPQRLSLDPFCNLKSGLKPCLIPDGDGKTELSAEEKERTINHAMLLAGMVSGCLAILVASGFVAGFDFLPRWLHMIQLGLANMQANDYNFYYAQMTSLVGSLLMVVPGTLTGPVRAAGYLLSFILLSAFALYVRRVERANLPEEEKLAFELSIGLLMLPLIVPYIRLYDLTVFLLPAWLLSFSASPGKLNKLIAGLATAFVLALDVYYLALTAALSVAQTSGAKLVLLALLVALIFTIHERFKIREQETAL